MLTITYEYRYGILFMRLKGELTKNTIYKYTNIINKIKVVGINNIVLNLSELNKIDSYGINRLRDSYRWCHKKHGSMFVCGNNINISESLKTNHLFKYIQEIPNELAAHKIIEMRVKNG